MRSGAHGVAFLGGWVAVGVVVAVGEGGARASEAASIGRAEALLGAGEFDRAAAELRRFLEGDPENRWAKEMLAFALESSGDLEGERSVRAALAEEAPTDARVQRDYGRVLERGGDYRAALAAYQRAEGASAEGVDAELAAAIDRTEGRTAVEVASAASAQSDPNARAARLQAGVAVPVVKGLHAALLAAHQRAQGARNDDGTAIDVAFAASLVLGTRSGALLMAGPRFHQAWVEGAAGGDPAVGGAVAGKAPLGTFLTAEGVGELQTPWDDSATAIRHGGRATTAGGSLYAHFFSWRLIVQAGARGRRFSVATRDGDSAAGRPVARQGLLVGGVDIVVWRNPGHRFAGEMLDDALVAPAALAAAVTVGYRHYEAFTDAAPAFAEVIALVPRGSIDEASVNAALLPAGGRLGVELRAGVGRDSARDAWLARFGPAVVWEPTASVRLSLRYEGNNETAGGFTGQRHAGWLGAHVDL